jgi:hypothetical protein
MLHSKKCLFYRDAHSVNFRRCIGYCDLDCDRTICDGDMKYCEKQDLLKKYLLEHKKREKEV